ncbi:MULTISPECIES: universal stress protein [Glycomyces]|jgi:nucleotide-binding universal stress UspA family protein|uniref:Nucleotide-binding universal stress UspA family protein n=1 Tax=Glycomyces artemisiae TaxID=1076443 RepID=A0A2T0URX2_9ACTN|nr:universal stress protein [Glycomyces artemisiae]NUQ88716.1 universal stress protein [Glycomyces artemisiae]PRY60597.1 nucleotide-binding universal stress UspA family protein [Glycomyces artemisiae]
MDVSEHKPDRIVVGVDGSAPSQRALEWALREAALTGAELEAVHAWEVPAAYGTGMVMTLPSNEEFESAAKQVLSRAVDQAAGADPGVVIVQNSVAGHPARVLMDAAEGASLLVVGSRGHGGFVGTLVGSVSQYCVSHAPCPVVVVRDLSEKD